MIYILDFFVIISFFCLLLLAQNRSTQTVIEGNAIIYVNKASADQTLGMYLDGKLEDGTYKIQSYYRDIEDIPKEVKLENCRFYLLDKEVIFWEYIQEED